MSQDQLLHTCPLCTSGINRLLLRNASLETLELSYRTHRNKRKIPLCILTASLDLPTELSQPTSSDTSVTRCAACDNRERAAKSVCLSQRLRLRSLFSASGQSPLHLRVKSLHAFPQRTLRTVPSPFPALITAYHLEESRVNPDSSTPGRLLPRTRPSSLPTSGATPAQRFIGPSLHCFLLLLSLARTSPSLDFSSR